MAEGHYRSPKAGPQVTFELEEGYAPLAGIAIVSCADPEGEPIFVDLQYGDMTTIEKIGLLTATLDQMRHDFIDREEPEEDED
jgi:hypothetical protein